jgi:hypothetical protein
MEHTRHRTKTKTNTTQKTIKISTTDPQKTGLIQTLAKGKQFPIYSPLLYPKTLIHILCDVNTFTKHSLQQRYLHVLRFENWPRLMFWMLELKQYGPICCLACGTGLSKTLNYEQITLYCRHIISKKGADWDHINWFKPGTMLCIS